MSSATLIVRRLFPMLKLQTRFPLALSGGLLVLLALAVIRMTLNAYDAAYSQFRSIALDSSAKVEASEQALQYIAEVDAAGADYIATGSDSKIHWQALDQINNSFRSFRDQMFQVRSNLDTDQEMAAYQDAETFAYEQFWQHIGTMMTDQFNGDRDSAVREYLIADDYMQNQVSRYLQQLEALNFQAMVDTERSAGDVIKGQVVVLAVLATGLGILLVALSFWIRFMVRRLITPGLDLAAVFAVALAILILIQLARLPQQLSAMVENVFYNVSASSRILAIANQAVSTQSGVVIDPAHASYWQTNFDSYKKSLDLRLCGQPDCAATPFTYTSNQQVFMTSPVISGADSISPENLAAIGGVAPLVSKANVAPEILEQARAAYTDYLDIDMKLRRLIQANDLDDALTLHTGMNPGQSGEAYQRFVQAVGQVRDANRNLFDSIWREQQATLTGNRLLFGLVGYGLLMFMLVVGVYHRYREL